MGKLKMLFATTLTMVCVVLLLTACGNSNNSEQPYTANTTTQQTINGIQWEIKWTYEVSASGEKISPYTIESISAGYELIDKSSIYWQEITYQHGDHSLYLKNTFNLSGIPLGDNWFQITKIERYIFGEIQPTQQVLYQSTTRYEEKLIFTLPDQS